MSDCCDQNSPDSSSPNKYRCPENGREYASVSAQTIKLHIKSAWNRPLKQQSYYFCKDVDCNVVYFGEDDSIIEKISLRAEVGVKQGSPQALICYCFGITRAEAMNNPSTRAFVIKETASHSCACQTLNPSGRCCLADFPKS